MNNNISKAQEEVWEWKEKAYEQIKDMPLRKALDFILKNTNDIIAQIKSNQSKPPIVAEPPAEYKTKKK